MRRAGGVGKGEGAGQQGWLLEQNTPKKNTALDSFRGALEQLRP